MKVGVKQFKKEYKGINIDKIDVRHLIGYENVKTKETKNL